MWTAKEGVLDWEINKSEEEEGDYRARERETEMEIVKRLTLKQMFLQGSWLP